MLIRSMATTFTVASASECLFADFLSEIEPKKGSEALKHPGWVDAMQEEMNQFYRNKNKARMVAQGYSQEEGFDYDETFAPMERMEATRFPGHACKLDKALYGLKQALKACSSLKTPMVPPNNLGPDLAGKPVNKTLYRGMIGSLMYLKGTSSLGLWYPKCLGFDLKGYPDLDYVGCNMDRKSTSAEAEYVAPARCYENILWMKSQLSDYDIHYKMIPIFCDNTSAISLSNNLVLHLRTKHFDIRYHFIGDHLKGDIQLHFIPTQYQLADIFTKPLDEPTFTRLKVELASFPNSPADNSVARPLKEFIIKVSVINGKNPLTLYFKTFCEATGLDYNQGTFVAHPYLEVVKAKLAKIAINKALVQKTLVNKSSFPMAWRILFTFVV
ncbi:retrovirus-related pol polyprotein from transposon TNT 1-94 [Tanacetum coccineum]